MGLILLDLDGTLVADALVEDDGKLQRRQHEVYSEPTLLPGRYQRLKQAAEEGDRFAIVTNQGGVAWGYHTQAEVYRRIGSALGQLSFFWARPFSVHVAFMHPRATVARFKGDDGRKPAPEMLKAALAFNLPPSSGPTVEAIMVGDREEDEEAARAAGVDYVDAGYFFAS